MNGQPGAGRPSPERQVVGVAARLLSRGLGLKFAALGAVVLFCFLCFAGLFFASSQSPASGECSFSGASGKGIPANYVPWLEKAATKYKLGPKGFSIVAAIHYVESDFGRSPLPGVARGTQNSAGAEGPGQFLVPSWETYGQDANGDGVKDVYGIPDSIFGTANYMHLSGAPKDWHSAIFAYNHAEWYVEEVLEKAASFGAQLHEVCAASVSGALGPLPTEALARVEYVAKWIEARRIHYCWGGGHAAKPGPSGGSYCWSAAGQQVFGAPEKGLDCSGAVRWLLELSGYKDTGPLVSGDFSSAYPAGPGRAVTIWSNVDHVFLEINGRDWGTSSSNFAHGPGFGSQPTAGFTPSHPPGL
jgi:Membrane-bound lytic murein transglycosylase B